MSWIEYVIASILLVIAIAFCISVAVFCFWLVSMAWAIHPAFAIILGLLLVGVILGTVIWATEEL